MKGRERLSVLHVHRSSRLVVKDYLVLSAMVFEYLANILPSGNEQQEADENSHPDNAIGGVEGNTPVQRRIPFAQRGHQVQWNKLIEKNKKSEREQQVEREHPGRNLFRLSLVRLFFAQHGVCGESQRLDSEGHRLPKGTQSAKHRVLEKGVFFR